MKVTIFIKNTVVLVFTSLCLRSAGMIFRVFIADKIGSEGMGLYQLIFSVYILASTFAASGISTAVTRLVAEQLQNGRGAVKEIMKKGIRVTLIIAAISVAIIFLGAEPIALYLLKDARATNALRILSVSLPFMGVSSCLRGYFIARSKTLQPSFAQILEQIIRMVVVFVLLSFNKTPTIEYSATAVLIGDTVAEVFSFTINLLFYIKDILLLPIKNSFEGATKKILKIALPLSLASYISTALHTVESLLIPSALAVFHLTRERGLELFGAVRGMALPVLFFPASFLTSFSTLLIPEVSKARSNGNRLLITETVERAVSTTATLSIFVAVCFFFHADQIGILLYNSSDVGQIIKILSPVIPFMYLESVSAGMLKGLDCQMSMLKYNTIDSVLRILAVFLLLPKTGIKGYLLIMIISNSLTSSLSLIRLTKAANVRLNLFSWIIKPAAISIAAGFIGFHFSANVSSLPIAVTISALSEAFLFFGALIFLKKSQSYARFGIVKRH